MSVKSIPVSICDCEVVSVVVFLDRAEVCRKYGTKLAAGEQDVVFTGLSSVLDKDSIRVEGNGPAIINEVAYNETPIVGAEEEKNAQLKELKAKKKELEEERERLRLQEARLTKQRAVLNTFADQYVLRNSDPPAQTPGESLCNQFGGTLRDNVSSFLGVFSENASSADEGLLQLSVKTKDLDEELQALTRKINNLHHGGGDKIRRDVSVLLDVKEEGEVELRVSYVVTRASWSPKYDIRVFSSDKQMKITYYGEVKQNTGESWDDARVLLSTASPSVGGTMPKLGALRVGIKPDLPPRRPMMKQKMMMRSVADHATCSSFPPPPMSAAPAMDYVTAEVTEGLTNATFEIPRLATIPSDNVNHKVTVGIVDLSPDFAYEAVPKKTTTAYLQARAVNSSSYAMLEGPCNVFLDNNFICKSTLKAVSPGERFNCWLGVDPSVRITYEPVRKFQTQRGFIKTSSHTTYTQVIKVRNTHQHEIKLTVRDHLPESMDQKVKVAVTEPVLGKPGECKRVAKDLTVGLTRAHNVVWVLTLAAAQARDLTLVYTIELPKGQELKFDEVAADVEDDRREGGDSDDESEAGDRSSRHQ